MECVLRPANRIGRENVLQKYEKQGLRPQADTKKFGKTFVTARYFERFKYMRRIIAAACILFSVGPAQSQSITLGTITPLVYCAGSALQVPYSASGSFASDNVFLVELSDSSGSFISFVRYGQATALSGTISVPLSFAGTRFRVQVASTDPYATSGPNRDDIQVVPPPKASVNSLYPKYWRYIGDTMLVRNTSNVSGAIYQWNINDTSAHILTQTDSAIVLSYSSEGVKSGSLSVTTPLGCKASATWVMRVLSCRPHIPNDVVTIRGIQDDFEDYYDSVLLIEPNSTLQNINSSVNRTFFVESTGAVQINDASRLPGDVYYVKDGTSVSFRGFGNGQIFMVLPRTMRVVLPQDWNQGTIDTIYCDDLTFQYPSNASVNSTAPSDIDIHQSSNWLSISTQNQPISVQIVSVLGSLQGSQTGQSELDIDLSSLRPGVYFVIAQSGKDRELRRIVVQR